VDLIAQTEEKRKRGASQEKMRKQSGNLETGKVARGIPRLLAVEFTEKANGMSPAEKEETEPVRK
jgi:hypothetical protein